MSNPDIAGILENSKELDRLRKEQEDALQEINKLHKKLQTNPEVVEKQGDTSLTKLRYFYTHAKELAENEVNVSTQLLSKLEVLSPSVPPGQQRRRMEGNDVKKKRMKVDTDITRLSPSLRNHLESCSNLKGEQVAAKVRPEEGEKDEWFVVKVLHFDRESREFEVLDEEEGTGQRRYKLPMSNIIPFPKRNDPANAPEYPPGRHVLAVYPGTTALYKATVVNGHRKHFIIQRKTDDYILEFEDDEENGALLQRTVPFHRVVALPEGHRQ